VPGAEIGEPPTGVAVGRCRFLRVTGRGVRSAVVWLREGTCQGLRGRSARHLMPFHASARVLLLEFTPGWVKKPPTATQREASGHETPATPRPSASERGPGTFSRCQLVPFHVSAKAPVPRFPGAFVEFPTAMQRAAAVQDTPFNDLAPVRGFAVFTSRQLVPFHASAKLGNPANP
jgi:hypothetical protein